jgi:hypothetical protein
MAVPVTSKTSGLTAVLFVIPTAPLIDPVVDGTKVTVNIHEAPEAKAPTQPDAL